MPPATGGDHGPPVEAASETLAAQAAAGDRRACRALVDRHLAALVRYANRMLGDAAEAEDVAQEAFLRLWRSLAERPEVSASIGAWLFRVAHNLCIDQLRRRRSIPLDDIVEPPDATPDAAEQMLAAERQRAVAAALGALPERQRAAILLCHYEGFSNAEAAGVLGVGVEAVESLLARGRRGLRQRLMADG